jgi:hypothetical protein
VPGDCRDAGDVRSRVSGQTVAACARDDTLDDVGRNHGATESAPENTHGVEASRIPRPRAADVDSASRRESRRDVCRRYGAEEVSGPEGGKEAGAAHPTYIMRLRRLVGVTGLGTLTWALAVRGSLTLDLGVGRRIRPLGPLRLRIAAPRELVFDVISSPYLGRTPRALRARLDVLERGEDLVLAEHFTPVYGLTATTVETVRFERPSRVHFRLVRGPVPHVHETFELHAADGETELVYSGELGTDLWAIGAIWGAAVARTWQATVSASLEGIRTEAERRARARTRPPSA